MYTPNIAGYGVLSIGESGIKSSDEDGDLDDVEEAVSGEDGKMYQF